VSRIVDGPPRMLQQLDRHRQPPTKVGTTTAARKLGRQRSIALMRRSPALSSESRRCSPTTETPASDAGVQHRDRQQQPSKAFIQNQDASRHAEPPPHRLCVSVLEQESLPLAKGPISHDELRSLRDAGHRNSRNSGCVFVKPPHRSSPAHPRSATTKSDIHASILVFALRHIKLPIRPIDDLSLCWRLLCLRRERLERNLCFGPIRHWPPLNKLRRSSRDAVQLAIPWESARCTEIPRWDAKSRVCEAHRPHFRVRASY
jgi:hypothetical protein